MKNRGFTLIELMAIIIITSTIGILSYASLSSSIKNNKLSEVEKHYLESLANMEEKVKKIKKEKKD